MTEESSFSLKRPERSAQEGQITQFDSNLLERLKTLWKFGAWKNLVDIEAEEFTNQEVIQGHAALLLASGKLQSTHLNMQKEVKVLLSHAKASGITKQEIYSMLISGVFNSLGRARAICNHETRAIGHFARSVAFFEDKSALNLVVRARIQEQVKQIAVPINLKEDLIDQCVLDLNAGSRNRVTSYVRRCLNSADIYDAIERLKLSDDLSDEEMVDLFMEISNHFWQIKDKLTALHFLSSAAEKIHFSNTDQKKRILDQFIEQGQAGLATNLAVSLSLIDGGGIDLNPQTKEVIIKSFNDQQKRLGQKSEHGHDLLLTYLSVHLTEIQKKSGKSSFTIIEIGTTRENVPGQGSTRKFAEFCKAKNMYFKTVDMDPHNSASAKEMFLDFNFPGLEAITAKGEDYLRGQSEPFDFVFLDAYDFDHGKHSQLRQSRYIKYLGSPIDDSQCHLMHLDCAESVLKNLAPYGLVCIDDTWLENGNWTAKGTLAMPYLLENGFVLLEARNRAALLARKDHMAMHSSL